MQKFLRVDEKDAILILILPSISFAFFKVNFLSGIYILFDLKEFNNPKKTDAYFNNMLIKNPANFLISKIVN